MKFENADGKPVEINFQNFEQTLPEDKQATREDILKATAEE
jgi:hypothetical protein